MAACPRETDAHREPDEQLVERVRSGDLPAFRQLVERYQDPILRLVRSLSRAGAHWEDLAQDVFMAAYAHLTDFDPDRGRFKPWLFAIARHR